MAYNLFRYRTSAFSVLHSENNFQINPTMLFVFLSYGRLSLCTQQGIQYANNEDDVSRGSFRLHLLRPDGTGVSEGCITFVNRPDFYTVRSQLLRTKKVKVPGSRTGLMAYGWVDVQGGSNYANCRIR
ncbi:MAG: DUF2778 domain-containing protein [Enterobacter sp.]|nr:DUF2778 domain-containing protein [Enterobacter sp.]